MTSFSDDFQRADGVLGANWYTPGDAVQIVGGKAHSVAGATARPAAVSSAGAHDATATIWFSLSQDWACAPVVKVNDSMTQGYRGTITTASGGYTATIVRVGTPNFTLSSTYFAGSIPNPCALRLTYSAGTLFFYVNATLRGMALDSTYDTNTRVGLFANSNATGIEDFTTSTPDTATFSVLPSSCQSNGPAIRVDMSGTGTSWSPGVPGTPTFTASAGSLAGQVVTSSTTAYAYFTPPVTEQSVTIADPSTGLTDSIWCSPNVPAGGGTGFAPKLTDAGAAVLNDAAVYPAGRIALTNRTPIIPSSPEVPGALEIIQAIEQIWHAHFGQWTGSPPDPISQEWYVLWQVLNGAQPWQEGSDIAAQLALTKGYASTNYGILHDLTATYTDLAQLTSLLGGNPIIYSNQDILAAIAALPLSDLSTYIHAMRGNDVVSLLDILQSLTAMRTLNDYTLQDILDAIGTGGGGGSVNLQPILDKLNLIQPNTAISLSSLSSALTALRSALDSMAGSLSSYRGPNLYTVQSILDALASLRTHLDGILTVPLQPPVWPGEAHVHYGASYDLATTVSIDQPMHGVRVHVTSCEPGTRYYQYDQNKSFRHIGALAFYNDAGDCETFQVMGFDHAVFVPKSLAIAQGVRFYKNRLPQGTVTPWLIVS